MMLALIDWLEHRWDQLKHWAWRLLPDRCQADFCWRDGVRGNENLVPRAGTLKPLILCDYCSVRYDKDGEIMVGGQYVNKRIEDELAGRLG